MSRARDNANLGAQAGSGLDASDITTGVLPVGVTGGSGLNAVSPANIASGVLPVGVTGGSGLDLVVTGVKPHIIPDVLYPAVANVMLDGTTALSAVTTGPNSSTVTSSKYGTVQSDGRMYYYTDIKGSKPIKDPRIGAHFGSQRHKFKSLQLLEQETATHGTNIYSVDGREWVRVISSSSNDVVLLNDSGGTGSLQFPTASSYVEITGYFNNINILMHIYTNRRFRYSLDGATEVAQDYGYGPPSPLAGRYVDSGSSQNIPITPSLGIHTIKLRAVHAYAGLFGIELIAQDTSNVNKIQIPSQNVVSYGKKFTVAGTPHYDPFNGFTNSTSLHSAYVDTATSLGLSTGTLHGATWAISGSNNIRPYNGGRVVKWVDSSGVIKTSVNMMPPNAQNISTTASAEITTPSATNTAYLPAMSDDVIDHSLSEVAKTFHYGEFGNGSANGNASYGDASTMTIADGQNLAYVMDDGLTSLSGSSIYNDPHGGHNTLLPYNDADYYYVTFIGTGISLEVTGGYGTGIHNITQNLPYGTHILKVYRTSIDPTYTIDGVSLGQIDNDTYGGATYIAIHQPKMPPIPEDAVVIADYMLMADYVAQTDAEFTQISKGVRGISGTRDIFYTGAFTATFTMDVGAVPYGMSAGSSHSSTTTTVALPFFGTNVDLRSESGTTAFNGGSNVTQTDLDSLDGGGVCDMKTIASPGITLGVNNVVHSLTTGGYRFLGYQVVTPIHTSSHYQTFETPFLHELVGGDRNMEQTNLVVTPDGKTWDEVTRDVSYIGNVCIQTTRDVTTTYAGGVVPFDEWRGVVSGRTSFNKDFAIAYDRMICLVGGWYDLRIMTIAGASGTAESHGIIRVNGTLVTEGHTSGSSHSQTHSSVSYFLKRGDYVQGFGGWYGGFSYSNFIIQRIGS